LPFDPVAVHRKQQCCAMQQHQITTNAGHNVVLEFALVSAKLDKGINITL
jgi:hypothetical protein